MKFQPTTSARECHFLQKRLREHTEESSTKWRSTKDITWEKARELGLKVVRSRWFDGWKALSDDKDGVRSRCLAQGINTHQRDDVYSGTPPLKCHRMVVSAAATRRPGQRGKKLVASLSFTQLQLTESPSFLQMICMTCGCC